MKQVELIRMIPALVDGIPDGDHGAPQWEQHELGWVGGRIE